MFINDIFEHSRTHFTTEDLIREAENEKLLRSDILSPQPSFSLLMEIFGIYNKSDNNKEGNTYMCLENIEEMIWNLGEGDFRKGYRVFHLDQNRGFQSKDVNESSLHPL